MDRIQVEGLGKRYLLGERGNLRETLSGLVRRTPRQEQELWSLRDVSFTVPDGGALGIVGRNGAGKSTILKILMRITAPTEGRSRTRGRVAALLEVGTGFHPELTGRENVFLNAAILGMPRAETARRFDEIVAFAGTEKFLDTPVKRYSSGMYLRLAFGVAAHLEPDVLIVDEVLAVGDAEFQRRCLGRMTQAEQEGRTVVFVSHDLHSLAKLCDRTLWLDGGRVRDDGPTARVVRDYLTSGFEADREGPLHAAAGPVRLVDVRATGEGVPRDQALLRDDALAVTVGLEVLEERLGLDIGIGLVNSKGVQVLEELLSDSRDVRFPPGVYDVVLHVPPVLNVGEYTISVWIGVSSTEILYEPAAGSFTVFGNDRQRPHRTVVLDLPFDVVPRTG